MIIENAHALLADGDLYAAHSELVWVSSELARMARDAWAARARLSGEEFRRFRELDAQLGDCCKRARLSAFKNFGKPTPHEGLDLDFLPASGLLYARGKERAFYVAVWTEEWHAAMRDLCERAQGTLKIANELRRLLRRRRRRRAAAKQPGENAPPSKIEAPVAPTTPPKVPRPPTGIAAEVLVAMYNLGATAIHRLVASPVIARKAVGPGATFENIKRPLGRLKKSGYILSVQHKGGGYYLTPAGRDLAAQLPGAVSSPPLN